MLQSIYIVVCLLFRVVSEMCSNQSYSGVWMSSEMQITSHEHKRRRMDSRIMSLLEREREKE